MQELERSELDRSERLLTIRLNTLLHRAPDAALPPVAPLTAPPAEPAALGELLALSRRDPPPRARLRRWRACTPPSAASPPARRRR